MEQCPDGQTKETGGSNGQREELQASTIPTASTAAQPFGPWLMLAHVCRKMQQTLERMNRQSVSLEANRLLNIQVEKESQIMKNREANGLDMTQGST